MASAFKRIGLIEQTSRGVDWIFEGQLRYGRPAPDYVRSDSSGVRVVLNGGEPSLKFASFVYEEDKAGSPFTLDDLLILNTVFSERRMDADTAGGLIQIGTARGRGVLEKLVERGLLDAKGEKPRGYHLSANLYRKLGKSEGYVRAHAVSPLRYEALAMEYVEAHGRIARKNVIELCGITEYQAKGLNCEGHGSVAIWRLAKTASDQHG